MSAISLRDVTQNDLPVFFEHQVDPYAIQMAAFPARSRAAFMAHWNKLLNDETILKKSILFDGQVAGNIMSFGRSAERDIGYWLGRQYWGKGIASKALAEFLMHEKTRPLYAHVAKHNSASIRVLEKCGFSISGEESDEFILSLSADK